MRQDPFFAGMLARDMDFSQDQHQKKAEKIRCAIYQKMSYADKWAQACKLRETARKLKAASVRAKHPDWDEGEVEQAVKKIFLYATT